MQSTFCTAPDLCKNVSLAVLFRSNGNSYTISEQAKRVEGESCKGRTCQGNLSAYPTFGSPELE